MQTDMLTTGALIALMVFSFYFLILRPGRRRQQEQAKTMQALTPGARVLLASGVYGRLISKADKTALVEIAPGVQVEVVTHAIVQVVPDQDVSAVSDAHEPGHLERTDPGDERHDPPAGNDSNPR